MKKILFFALALLVLSSCQEVNKEKQLLNPEDYVLHVVKEENPAWQYENLQLFPITANTDFIEANKHLKEYKTLSEALELHQFRISEKKPYGRFEDAGAVNSLTVQNKTAFPIFLMEGEIVQGGRQDRVVENDQVIAARSLKDIPVFCVEKGRWNYHDATDEEAASKAKQDKIFAFSGYYHVAAGSIRHTLANNQGQNEVWEKVHEITAQNDAESSTHAYASLEESTAFTTNRNSYLNFFADKFSDMDQVVGVVAVSGNKIIAAELFGHPDLFQRQFNNLLHSYVTDAITKGSSVKFSQALLKQQESEINEALFIEDSAYSVKENNRLLHYFTTNSQ